jgi:hypothetical protein
METKFTSIEEIQSALDQLRQDPNTQRKFPQELWASIIQQTKIFPLEQVCRQLQINPTYLKQKIRQSKEQILEFREISIQIPPSSSDMVTIELNSSIGMTARIQGLISCLSCLCKLFGR